MSEHSSGPSGLVEYQSQQAFERDKPAATTERPVVIWERHTTSDPDARGGHVVGVAVVIGLMAAVVAGATIWLLLTDPVTVASAVEEGEISPLVRELAGLLYDAVVALLQYL